MSTLDPLVAGHAPRPRTVVEGRLAQDFSLLVAGGLASGLGGDCEERVE